MKNFKDIKYKISLLETTLSDTHINRAKTWYHHLFVSDKTKEKINSALGGKDFTHFELPHEVDVHPDVQEHLEKHGYNIHDYVKGIASTTKVVGDPSNGIPETTKTVYQKIGSVLNNTNASDDVKRAFVNDPNRSIKKDSDNNLHVVISTNRNAIAGMSTGTDWRNTSCMDMDTGVAHHKLENDSQHGTHVAFLVRHDDPTAFKTGLPTKPLARISLKAFHNSKDNDDVIYLPEQTSYGKATSQFENELIKWSAKNYPPKVGAVYQKNRALYDDDGRMRYIDHSADDLINAINGKHSPHRINSGTHFNKSTLDSAFHHVMNSENKHEKIMEFSRLAANISKEQANSMYSHLSSRAHKLTFAHDHGDKLNKQNLNEVIDLSGGPKGIISENIVKNQNFPDEKLHELHVNMFVHIPNRKLNNAVFDKFVDTMSHKPESGHEEFVSKLPKEHIKKLIAAQPYDQEILDAAMESPHFDREVHDHILNIVPRTIKSRILQYSRFATFEDAQHAGNNFIPSLLANKTIDKKELIKAKNHVVDNFNPEDDNLSNPIYRVGQNSYQLGSHLANMMDDNDHDKLADKTHKEMTTVSDVFNIKRSKSLLKYAHKYAESGDMDNAKKYHESFIQKAYRTMLRDRDSYLPEHLNELHSVVGDYLNNDKYKILKTPDTGFYRQDMREKLNEKI